MRRFVVLGIALFSLLLLTDVVYGQCAMCGAIAEDAADDKAGVGIGINKGIIFLMAIPYGIFAVLAWVFFRENIKRFLIQTFKR